jgi:hypothetical protein
LDTSLKTAGGAEGKGYALENIALELETDVSHGGSMTLPSYGS